MASPSLPDSVGRFSPRAADSAESGRTDVHAVIPGEPALAASPMVGPGDEVSTRAASGEDLTPSRLVQPPGLDRPSRRWPRRVAAGLVLSVFAGLLYYFISLFQVWSTGRVDDTEPVDAIVVMGAAQYDGRPSPQLAARLDHVVELWPDELAPLVVVTGGNIPGDRFTEAEASAEYLVERGVPGEALILEDEGSSTFQSLDSVAEMLADRGLQRVLIVTDPYHALRSRMIAEEVGLVASVSSTDTSVVTGGDSLWRHVQEAGGVAVGRVIGFERLADLVD
ncbi:MAG: YdcF family protein [Ilumatobacter sp.]